MSLSSPGAVAPVSLAGVGIAAATHASAIPAILPETGMGGALLLAAQAHTVPMALWSVVAAVTGISLVMAIGRLMPRWRT